MNGGFDPDLMTLDIAIKWDGRQELELTYNGKVIDGIDISNFGE